MAAPAVTATDVLMEVPFLIVRLTFTTGTTAGDIAHGGPSGTQPDMVIFTHTAANPTDSSVSWVVDGQSSDSSINVDCEDDGNDTKYAYCFWFAQARQDGQSISQDNG